MEHFRPLAERAKGKIQLVVGVKGIRKQRNLITQWFPENLHLVSFDDDVRPRAPGNPAPVEWT